MLAAHRAFEAEAARHAPIVLAEPFDDARAANEALSLPFAQGGPVMAQVADHWVPTRGRRVQCRLYRPTAAGTLPVLVFFHGGGWVWASVETHDRLARELAGAAGCAVVSVDYALSPEAKFPQALEECVGVVRWIARHGAAWGLDPARIALGGDSAGGNLALGAALCLRDTGGPGLAALLPMYPVCAADFSTPSYQAFGAGAFFLSEEKMRFYWRAYLPTPAAAHHPWAAPLLADLSGLPSMFVPLAELDVLASEGHALVKKAREAGVKADTALYAGCIHGFLRQVATVTKARQAIADSGRFLARALAI